jgi:hypothetical protein
MVFYGLIRKAEWLCNLQATHTIKEERKHVTLGLAEDGFRIRDGPILRAPIYPRFDPRSSSSAVTQARQRFI